MGAFARAGQFMGRYGSVTVLSMLFCRAAILAGHDGGAGLFHLAQRCCRHFGIETMGADHTGLMRAADIAQHDPAGMTLALYYMASYARLARAAMIEVADQDFVKTARAPKGIGERARCTPPHPAQCADPADHLCGPAGVDLVGGTVLVEEMCSRGRAWARWPMRR